MFWEHRAIRYPGGIAMMITTNTEKMARTARQTAEMQRNAYEAMAKNFSALQRRNVEFTQMWMTGGFELMRAYQSFVSPFSYAQRDLKAAQQTTQYTQQALEVTEQELRVAEEATEQATERAGKAEQAVARAEKDAEKANAKAAKATEQVNA